MSSVIVLDSSDEDEAPTKKLYLPPSIPATITPIKAVETSTSATNGSITPLLATTLKHKKPKPRTIPSGITITRRSPITVVASSNSKITTTTNSSSNVNTIAKVVPTVGGVAASTPRVLGPGAAPVVASRTTPTTVAVAVATATAIAAAAAATKTTTTASTPNSNRLVARTTTTKTINSTSTITRPAIVSNDVNSKSRAGSISTGVVPSALHVAVSKSNVVSAARALVAPTSGNFGATRAAIATTVAASFAKSASNNPEVILPTLLTTTDKNISMPTLPTLPKINAAFSLGNAVERQTSTPPRQVIVQQSQQQQHQKQQPQMLPQLSQLPQLQPAPSVLRKRLTNAITTSPPQLLPQQPVLQQQPPLKVQQQPQQVILKSQQQPPLKVQQQQTQQQVLFKNQQQQQQVLLKGQQQQQQPQQPHLKGQLQQQQQQPSSKGQQQQQQPPLKAQQKQQQPQSKKQPQTPLNKQQQQPQQQQQTHQFVQKQQQQQPSHQFVQRQQPQPPQKQQIQLQPVPKQQQQQQQHQQQQKQQQQRSLSNSPATITPIGGGMVSNVALAASNPSLVPMISTVQSMAASATPPLQLLATPPHSAATTFNEQLLFSPELRHATSTLPPSTTVTAMPPLTELSLNNNNNTNTTNNNFKIQLPSKRSNSSNQTTTMISSPTTSSPATVSTLWSKTINTPSVRNVNSTAKITPISSNSSTTTVSSVANNTKLSALVTPPSTPTTIMSSAPAGAIVKSQIKRVIPTTIIKSNDDAWLKRPRTATSFGDDVMVVELPSKSASSSPKLMTAATKVKESLSGSQSPKPQTPPLTSKKSPKYRSPPVFDLTESPDKSVGATTASNSTTPNSFLDKSCERLNGEASLQSPNSNISSIEPNDNRKTSTEERPSLQPEYEELLKVCRKADSSADMEKLVNTKMLKYYYNVHPDFVRSKGFRRNLRAVTENIRREPDLVYVHLKTIVDELKVRIKSRESSVVEVETEEEVASSSNTDNINMSTGNKHTDEQIKKLSKALYIITRRIAVLDAAEVDWDEEDSNYVKSERFKKRACQIHEKLCALTGESKNAHRLAKKPVNFNGTPYTQFNKTLGAYINRTKEFPDYYDVLRMLEHCGRKFNYDLAQFEMKRIAHDAFMKVGKLLQSRRKTDLYETVTHYTANEKDPATLDPMLQAKLSENQKKQTRISDVIEKYAREQDMLAEERQARAKSAKIAAGQIDASGSVDIDSDNSHDDCDEKVKTTKAQPQKSKKTTKQTKTNGKTAKSDIDTDVDEIADIEDDDDDDEDDDEEDVNDSDIEADVENLANGDITDGDSDGEIVLTIPGHTPELADLKQVKDKTHHKKQTKESSDMSKEFASTSMAAAAAETAATTATVITTKSAKGKGTKPTIMACDKTGKLTTTAITSKTATTVKNTNITRKETVDPLAILPKKFEKVSECNKSMHAHTPNGRIKLNNVHIAAPNAASPTAQPALKIVSVSSLNEKILIDENKKSNKIVDSTAPKPSNKLVAKSQAPAIAEAKQLEKQQAVAEIVISDEES